MITVTKGSATPAEIAVIVAVLLATQATIAAPEPPARRSAWAEAYRMREALPTSWRGPALPR